MFSRKSESTSSKNVSSTSLSKQRESSFLKMILYGVVGAGAALYLTKKAEIAD